MSAGTERPPRLDDLPDLLTPAEVIAWTRLARRRVYELLATGALPSCRIGRTYRIPKAALLAFLGLDETAPVAEEGHDRGWEAA